MLSKEWCPLWKLLYDLLLKGAYTKRVYVLYKRLLSILHGLMSGKIGSFETGTLPSACSR